MTSKSTTLLLLLVLSSIKRLVADWRAIEIGNYATIAGLVEKVFVDTEGTAHKILKGGVVLGNGDGSEPCHIVINEARDTYSEEVVYAVDCAALIPTSMSCPDGRMHTYNCTQEDIVCISYSLYWNGYVVIEGPVTG